MTKNYTAIYSQLEGLMGQLTAEAPQVMDGFTKLHGASTEDRALDKRPRS